MANKHTLVVKFGTSNYSWSICMYLSFLEVVGQYHKIWLISTSGKGKGCSKPLIVFLLSKWILWICNLMFNYRGVVKIWHTHAQHPLTQNPAYTTDCTPVTAYLSLVQHSSLFAVLCQFHLYSTEPKLLCSMMHSCVVVVDLKFYSIHDAVTFVF